MISAISYLIGSNLLPEEEDVDQQLEAEEIKLKNNPKSQTSTPAKGGDKKQQQISSPIDTFNSLLSGALEAEVEGEYGLAADLLEQAEEFVTSSEDPIASNELDDPPDKNIVSPRSATCHLCGRRVASIVQHMKTCPLAQHASSSSVTPEHSPPKTSNDARPAMMEMVKVSQKRLESTIITRMRKLSKDGSLDETRRLWCAGSASLRSTDCDGVFSATVRAHFVDFAGPVLSALETARSLEVNKFAKGNDYIVHPYIRAHAKLLAEASGLVIKAAAISQSNATEEQAGAFGLTSRADSAHLQAHLEALSTLLGEASTWMAMILEQEVPHSSRCEVAGSLHKACVELSLPVVRAYRDDGLLTYTASVAKALIDCAEGGQDSLIRLSQSQWESTLRFALNPVQSNETSRSALFEHSIADSMNAIDSVDNSSSSVNEAATELCIRVEFEPPSNSTQKRGATSSSVSKRGQAPKQQSHLTNSHDEGVTFINPDLLVEKSSSSSSSLLNPSITLSPVNLTLDGATAVVDEACEKATFICQILERYLRCVTVCLGLGTSDQPSRTSDALAEAMHELQGDYVLLERAFLTTAVARATVTRSSTNTEDSSSDGWTPVVMGDDPDELCFAWVDHSLFILSKAIARACATCCDLAAAAVINFVSQCVDVDLRRVANKCIEFCSELRADESKAIVKRAEGSERDDVDDEVARRIAEALAVDDERACDMDATARPLQGGGMLLEDKDAEMIAAISAARKPHVSDNALIALNTVSTAASYLRSLFLKTRTEVELVFPPPVPIKSNAEDESSLDSFSQEIFSRPPRCHPLVAGTLDNFRSIVESFTKIADDAAKVVAFTLISNGLNSMRSVFHPYPTGFENDISYSYMISQKTFDVMTTMSSGRIEAGKGATLGSSDPLLSAFEFDLVVKSGLAACLHALRKQDSIDTDLGASCTADLVLRHVSIAVAQLVEESWTTSTVSEYGALLQAAQLREFIRRLSSLARNPHVAVARPFSRLSQIASVLALDSLPDLYSLTFFPKALLTRAEISKLIMLRVGLVKSQAAVDAIVWDRVQCVFKS